MSHMMYSIFSPFFLQVCGQCFTSVLCVLSVKYMTCDASVEQVARVVGSSSSRSSSSSSSNSSSSSTERETGRQTDRQKQREREIETNRESEKEKERERISFTR